MAYMAQPNKVSFMANSALIMNEFDTSAAEHLLCME